MPVARVLRAGEDSGEHHQAARKGEPACEAHRRGIMTAVFPPVKQAPGPFGEAWQDPV